MKVLIYGGSAEGCYLAARLAQAGHGVTIAGAGKAAPGGELKLCGRRGKLEIVPGVEYVVDVHEALANGGYDWIALALPAYETASAGEVLVQHLRQPVPVVTFQRGTGHTATLQTILGHGDVIAGAITAVVARSGANAVEIVREGGICLGGSAPSAGRIRDALASIGVEVVHLPDVATLEWSKLFVDLIGNALSAMLDEPPREVFKDYHLFDVEWAALNEALWTLEQRGITLTDLPGAPARTLAGRIRRLPRQLTRLLLIRQVNDQPSSLLQELRSGEGKTEAAWLNGAVVFAAHTIEYLAPINHALALSVSDIAAGRVPWEMFRHNPDMVLRAVRMVQGGSLV